MRIFAEYTFYLFRNTSRATRIFTNAIWLKNRSDNFQRIITEVLVDFIKNKHIVVYIYDKVIATKTVEEYLVILKKISRSYKLEQFLQHQREVLGYKINRSGISLREANSATNYIIRCTWRKIMKNCVTLMLKKFKKALKRKYWSQLQKVK